MTKYLFLLTILVGLTSCEKETYFEFIIENNSSTIVSIHGADTNSAIMIDSTVEANSLETIATITEHGKFTELLMPETMLGSNLIIINALGDTLQKDYKIIENWETKIDEKRSSASHKYILKISDSDFYVMY